MVHLQATGQQLQNENRTLDSPYVRSQITALSSITQADTEHGAAEVSMNEAEIVNNLATKCSRILITRVAAPGSTAGHRSNTSESPSAGQPSPQPSASPAAARPFFADSRRRSKGRLRRSLDLHNRDG